MNTRPFTLVAEHRIHCGPITVLSGAMVETDDPLAAAELLLAGRVRLADPADAQRLAAAVDALDRAAA
jgi:hypothetical protein